jgi:hypothetical protein
MFRLNGKIIVVNSETINKNKLCATNFRAFITIEADAPTYMVLTPFIT